MLGFKIACCYINVTFLVIRRHESELSYHRNDKHFKLERNALVFPDEDPSGNKVMKMKENLIADQIFFLIRARYYISIRCE